MATLTFPELRSRGRAGYNGPGYPTIDPRVLKQAEQARIAAQSAREQSAIQARAEAAQAEREFKAEQDAAKMKAQLESDIAKQTAALNLAAMRTNSAWNLSKNKPTVTRKIVGPDNSEITLHLTAAENDALDAKIKAEKNAPELAKLQAELDMHTRNILEGDKRFGFLNLNSRSERVAELGPQIAALKPPADLLKSNDVIAPSAPTAPTPSGFIGSPGVNTFLDTKNPDVIKAIDGMNRDQINAYAIKRNAPPELRPVIGDLRAAEGNLSTGPIPQDPPMAPFNPNAVDAPARPKIPKSHIEHLFNNPDSAKAFDEKYGAGTADEILNR